MQRLETRALTKRFRSTKKTAVREAAIHVEAGKTVGFFGESGSGKSTLGLMVAGLVKPTAGTVCFDGQPISMPYRGTLRRRIQILFQHPEQSFNPVLPIGVSMKEPYEVTGRNPDGLLKQIARFGLREEHMERLPAQLSGGELQRAALARILILEPELIVLDEPTSMLDVITQAQIMSMLRREQEAHGTAYILITHSRILCERFADRIYRAEDGIFTEETT